MKYNAVCISSSPQSSSRGLLARLDSCWDPQTLFYTTLSTIYIALGFASGHRSDRKVGCDLHYSRARPVASDASTALLRHADSSKVVSVETSRQEELVRRAILPVAAGRPLSHVRLSDWKAHLTVVSALSRWPHFVSAAEEKTYCAHKPLHTAHI